MKIRPAKKSDHKELMSLLNKFVQKDRYSKLDNDSFLKVLNSQHNYIYIAEENDLLIGLATLSVRHVVRYKKPIAELDELFVSTQARGKGCGKKLIQAIINQAKKNNCHRLYIETAYKWKVAHKIYESIGFKNYGYHFYKDL